MENNNDLMEQIFRFETLFHRYQNINYRMRGPFGNPHKGQGRVLSILKLQPQISQKELSFLLDMRSQSLGELLTKLENNGYITREASASDRRVMLIKLTAAGEAAATAGDPQSDEDLLIHSLSENERSQFSAIMDKLTDTLKQQIDKYDLSDDKFAAPWKHHTSRFHDENAAYDGFGAPWECHTPSYGDSFCDDPCFGDYTAEDRDGYCGERMHPPAYDKHLKGGFDPSKKKK